MVFGTLVTALAQGTLIGIAFWITGLPSPVVFGGLAFIASFVPFVGTALVVAPAVPLSAGAGRRLEDGSSCSSGASLVAGSADNFLRPALVSGRAEIGTLTAFFGVIGGIAAFGLVGLFLGPGGPGPRPRADRSSPRRTRRSSRPPARAAALAGRRLLPDPVGDEDVRLVRLRAVAVGGEHDPLAVARQHREAVEVGTERHLRQARCRPRGSDRARTRGPSGRRGWTRR